MFFRGSSVRRIRYLFYLHSLTMFLLVTLPHLTRVDNNTRVVATIRAWGRDSTNLIRTLEFVDRSKEKLYVSTVINQVISSWIVGSYSIRKLNLFILNLVLRPLKSLLQYLRMNARMTQLQETVKQPSDHITALVESSKLNTCLVSSSSKWVINSGATDHMTGSHDEEDYWSGT
ncbi:hypothetical protein V6Z11_A08G153600 [Gossypium hirsutum]|uniref:uncharacterized protein LOC108468254 n=1 Tax=Gossypium arboreum TaxID=29729 RepID=UPI0007CA960B|nr:uncharacterized protein LOC108468254 [Gossypium arboreum]